jgi:hypothetical protein
MESSNTTDLLSEAGDYFLQIESHFAHRRGTPFVFSAKDWALLKGWRDDGVPVAIVLEAIDSCFDKQEKSGRKRTISSLSYCRHAVVELWSDRKELQAGTSAAVPEIDPARHLGELARTLEESARESDRETETILTEAAAEVRALATGRSVPQIEEALIALEGRFHERLWAQLPDQVRRELTAKIDSELGATGGEAPEHVASARDAALRRALRRRLSIPRLSMFG